MDIAHLLLPPDGWRRREIIYIYNTRHDWWPIWEQTGHCATWCVFPLQWHIRIISLSGRNGRHRSRWSRAEISCVQNSENDRHPSPKLLSCCGSIPRPSHEFTMLARHHQRESGQQHTATDCIQPPGHNGSRYLKTLMAFLSLFLCQRNGRDASIDLELIHQTLAFDVLRLSESLGARWSIAQPVFFLVECRLDDSHSRSSDR